MAETIERLKREKIDSGQNFFDDGKVYGFNWAANSHYDDIQAALDWSDLRAVPRSEAIREMIQAIFQEDQSGLMGFSENRNSADCFNKYALLFFKGWKEGVTELWAQVKDKI